MYVVLLLNHIWSNELLRQYSPHILPVIRVYKDGIGRGNLNKSFENKS